jgi:putative transposase
VLPCKRKIAFALKQAELSILVEQVCREIGISDATFHNWKKKYGGLAPSELRRLRQLEKKENQAQEMRIKEIATTRVDFGYRRVHLVLRRIGWRDNIKRVYYYLYQQKDLSLRFKRLKRNRSARLRQPKLLVTAMNQIWSMDFVADAFFDGRRLRALTVVDTYTRESLAIDVVRSLKREHVANTRNRITVSRGLPATIKLDYGSEFISKATD